jgi:DNA-binding CsgD family transcriptional regulator
VTDHDYMDAWPLLERSDEVAAVLAALTAPDMAGVLIVGPTGVGKTAIVREVAARLEGTAHVTFVRGSAAMSLSPYGALGVLLVDVDVSPGAGSLPLLQSVQAALMARARDRDVVLLIDNVQHLDDESVMVLSYLAELGTARLVVACDGRRSTPASFFDLWRRGRLERVDVAPLVFDAMRGAVEELLGGALSGTAAVELWRASGGNPRYLQTAVRSSTASGCLARAGTFWVWHSSYYSGFQAERNDGVLAPLAALSAEAREMFDLIAVTGPVPLDALLPHSGAAVIDELEQAGVCAIDAEAPHEASVVNGLIGDRVRAVLTANPRPALAQALQRLDGGGLLSDRARVNLLRWFLDTRASLSHSYLRDAARLANGAGEADLALRAIGRLTTLDAASGLEQIRACLIGHRIGEGRAVLERMLAAEPDSRLRAFLLTEQMRLSIRSPQYRAGAAESLAETKHLITDLSPADEGPVTEQIHDVAIDVASHEGRFREVLVLAGSGGGQESRTGAPALERAVHVVLARSLTGEGPGAKRSLALLEGSGASIRAVTSSRAVKESAFLALVHEGYLEDALSFTSSGALATGAWQDASVADTLAGGALAGLGRGKDALEVILPAVQQLRVDNRSGLLPVAEAVAAYACALVGRRTDVDLHAGNSMRGERLAWVHRSAISLFATLSMSLLSDSDAAARRFVAMADGQLRAGNRGSELILRMHAVRLGQQAQAPLLLELARGISTPLANTCELLGRGVAARDSLILLEAAEAAMLIGHLDLAGSAALTSMRLHETEDEPLHFIRAEQIFRRTHVPRRNASARRILTERERVFARMAARGATNKEIASKYHLSVRTVEGHILKAMAKLGISSRKQLAQVFGR